MWRKPMALPAPANGNWFGPRVRLVWLGSLVAALLGCASDASLSPLSADAVVLAFGDSLTHGTGATAEQSYPAVLQTLIGRQVINAGVPGELSAAGLQRLPGVLETVRPALVILCHGGNDILRKRNLGAAERNLRQMIAAIRASGAQVVLVGVPAPSLFLTSAAHYARIAEEMGVPFDGDTVGDLLGDNRYKSDTVHPNATGYAVLAEQIRGLLTRAGAI